MGGDLVGLRDHHEGQPGPVRLHVRAQPAYLVEHQRVAAGHARRLRPLEHVLDAVDLAPFRVHDAPHQRGAAEEGGDERRRTREVVLEVLHVVDQKGGLVAQLPDHLYEAL